MKNVKELRDELVTIFYGIKKGEIEVSQGKALVTTSNAMLKSAQLELEHAKLVGNKKIIKFLETE